MRYIQILFLVLVTLAVSSCRKYVEITPKGKVVPSEVRDYRQLLNNTSAMLSTIGMNEYGTDDISYMAGAQFLTTTSELIRRIYNWDSFIYAEDAADNEWNTLYKQIYTANVVIEGIPSATGGTATEKDQLMGEALVHRANNYLYLVNMYAKAYDAATAGTDPGVPLVLKPDLNASLVRVPVQQVYDQILKDLTEALPLLPNDAAKKYYAGKAAVHALLARTYLLMNDHAKAASHAGQARAINGNVLDYNTLANNPENTPVPVDNPEIIYWKSASNAYGLFFFSDEILNLFTTGDLRKKLLTVDGMALLGLPGTTFNGEYNYNLTNGKANFFTRNVGPTVPEMMLIESEYLARSGKEDDAVALLNQLRIKRISTADYAPLANIPSEEVLKVVLDERRRELFMKGHRWFDLRRFNREPQLAKTLVHTWTDGSRAELAPGSPRYVFPIPPMVAVMSPEIVPNPR